jgi:N-terminal domain of anti-restriction factor ArdC
MNSHEIAELTTKAIEELARALEAGHSEALTQYLAAISRFHKYSLHNVMLIVLQQPAATHVAGFHTWHKLGRHVRKGEKGITIFAPILRREKAAENASEESAEELVLGYRTCAVFDVSQTEGKPLPTISLGMPAVSVRGLPPMRFHSASGSNTPRRSLLRGGFRKAGRLPYCRTCPPRNTPLCSRTNWPTNSFTTSRAAQPRQRPCARPKPKQWPMWSAKPSDSTADRPPPITFNYIVVIRSC